MKLQIYSVNNRYVFRVGKFSSSCHFFLCPDIKPTYKYAWEAYRDAHRLYNYHYIHIDALQKLSADDLAVSDLASETHETSAEQMIVDHYSKIFEIMVNRTKSFKNDKDKELVYGEVKAIVSGILKVKESLEKEDDKSKIDKILDDFRDLVKEKFPSLLAKDKAKMESEKDKPQEVPTDIPNQSSNPQEEQGIPNPQGLPMMPSAKVDAIMRYSSHTIHDIKHEILDEYAERICKFMEKHHPDAICKIDYEDGMIKIARDGGGSLLRVHVDDNLNVQDIEPDGELNDAFPLQSIEFYQKYWKPIVEKIGHCLSRDLGIIICPAKSSLPDIPNSFPNSVQVMGWNVKERSERPFELYFGGEKPTWILRKVDFVKEATRKIRPSKYTEEDFIHGQPRRVQCIDPNLKSIQGKIGEVVQVIPLQDHIELDVNFGRLVVRLTESQIELIDEIPPNI